MTRQPCHVITDLMRVVVVSGHTIEIIRRGRGPPANFHS